MDSFRARVRARVKFRARARVRVRMWVRVRVRARDDTQALAGVWVCFAARDIATCMGY